MRSWHACRGVVIFFLIGLDSIFRLKPKSDYVFDYRPLEFEVSVERAVYSFGEIHCLEIGPWRDIEYLWKFCPDVEKSSPCAIIDNGARHGFDLPCFAGISQTGYPKPRRGRTCDMWGHDPARDSDTAAVRHVGGVQQYADVAGFFALHRGSHEQYECESDGKAPHDVLLLWCGLICGPDYIGDDHGRVWADSLFCSWLLDF